MATHERLSSLLQPRTFAGLMAVYESNYRRLARLAPGLATMTGHAVSRIDGALDLHIEVHERHKYTTVLQLTYYFDHGFDHGGDDAGVPTPEPAAEVWVYHDAGQAEVVACNRRRRPRPADPERSRSPEVLEWRWDMNRFLNKWLGYCLAQGHYFDPARKAALADTSDSLVYTP